MQIQDENNDFFEISKILTFEASDTSSSETASFTSIDDVLPEPAEIFMLTLQVIGNGASIGSPSQAQVTVEDSDDAFGIIGFDMVSLTYVLYAYQLAYHFIIGMLSYKVQIICLHNMYSSGILPLFQTLSYW